MDMEGYLDEMFDLKPSIIQPDLNPSSAAANCTNSSSKLLSFENSKNSAEMVKPQIINFSSLVLEDDEYNYDMEIDASNGMISSSHKRPVTVANRTPLQAQDHVMAERKRRQKLGQLFISLSKVVPGLKKLDKASLLEDAIDHIKALQKLVNTLEEEQLKRSTTSTIDSISIDEEEEDDDDGISGMTSTAPEIKAMISNNSSVLIKVCCKIQKGLISRIPWEMEKMHLSVKDIRIMPFGGVTLVITILAEMQNEFRGTVRDIIEQLEMVFLNQLA